MSGAPAGKNRDYIHSARGRKGQRRLAVLWRFKLTRRAFFSLFEPTRFNQTATASTQQSPISLLSSISSPRPMYVYSSPFPFSFSRPSSQSSKLISSSTILLLTQNHYQTTRNAAASYIQSHADDFLPFLPSVQGEDGAGADSDGLMTPTQLLEYTRLIRETGEWGGEPEILALSKAFDVPIHVVQQGPPAIVVHSPDPEARGTLSPEEAREIQAVRITYHTRMYGLGAHYNSRPSFSFLFFSSSPCPCNRLCRSIGRWRDYCSLCSDLGSLLTPVLSVSSSSSPTSFCRAETVRHARP
jgi:hypothetical protein